MILFLTLLAVAIGMVVIHEAAHVVTTMAIGGRFEGVVVKHVLAVGVKIRVDDLSARQVALTLIAGPLAEVLVVAAAWMLVPGYGLLWLGLMAIQWTMNLVPWPWFANDGRKLLRLVQLGRVALEA